MLEVTGSIPVSPTITIMNLVISLIILMSMSLFSVDITIPSGASAKWVSQHLKESGIVSSPNLFYLYLRANQLTNQIHQGSFHIPKESSFKDIANIITGKTPQWITVTIPEGLTLDEILSILKEKKIISDINAFKSYLSTMPVHTIDPTLKNSPQVYEGLFFPDTYYFGKRSSNEQVYNAFINQTKKELIAIYKSQSNPKLNFYDTLILASIIEKEAGTKTEMPTISGVFHNRLTKKMYLASCPTVGYALGEPRKKQLTYKDLDVQSPYNTYRQKGLPPTPIASPGKRAFIAALNPEDTPYFYFVSKNDGTGTHVFSRTLKEHVAHQKRIQNLN